MNILGFFAPKIVFFLIILFSSVSLKNKGILLTIWLIKLNIDYSAAKPGRGGLIYKPLKNMKFEIGELIVACIQFVPSVIFLIIARQMNTWILLVPGVFGVLAPLVLIIGCIKEIKTAK